MASNKSFQQKQSKNSFVDRFLTSFFWPDDFPAFVQHILALISNAQYLGVMVYGQILFTISSYGDSFSDEIKEIFSLGGNFFEDRLSDFLNSFAMTTITLYLMLLILLIMYTAFLAYNNKRMSDTLRKIAISFFQLHACCLSLIVTVYFIGNLSCRSQFLYFGSTSSSSNTAIVIIHTFIIIINFMSGLIISSLSYDPFRSNNAFASYTSHDQAISYIYKSIAGILLGTCNMSEFTQWLFVLITLLFSAMRCFILTAQWPYYHQRGMKVNLISTYIGGLIGLTNLIGKICSSANNAEFPQSIIYAEILMVPLCWYCACWQLRKTLCRYINLPLRKLATTPSVYKKLYSIRTLMDTVKISIDNNKARFSNFSEIYFFGLIKAHSVSCEKEKCLCKLLSNSGNYYKPFDISELRNTYQEFTFQIEYETLSQAIKLNGKRVLIEAHLADLLIENKSVDLRCIFAIYNILKRTHSFKERLIIFHLQEKIQSRIFSFFNEANDCINMKEYIEYQESATALPTLLSSNIQKHIEFWETYMKPEVNLMELLNKSIQIETEAEKIAASWNHFAAQYSKVAMNLYPLYGLYLSHIRNCQYSGEKILKKHRQFIRLEDKSHEGESEINKHTIKDRETGSIFFSMNKERFGKILKISQNITEELGWRNEDLIGKNIPSLFPTFLQTGFIKALEAHSEGVNNYLHQNIAFFINDSQGNILPCNIYLSFSPYLGKEMNYICFIRLKKSVEDFILINNDGKIEGWTSHIGEVLGLKNTSSYRIQDFCRDWNMNITGKSDLRTTVRETSFSVDNGHLQISKASSLRMKRRLTDESSHDTQQYWLRFNALSQGINFNRELLVRTENKIIFDISLIVLTVYPFEKQQQLTDFRTVKCNPYENNDDSKNIPSEGHGTNSLHKTTHILDEDVEEIEMEELDEFVASPKKESSKLIKKIIMVDEKEPQVINSTDSQLLNELKARKVDPRRFAFDRDSSSVMSANNQNIFSHLEEAVYVVPRENSLKILHVLVLLFFVLCGSMLVVQFFTTRRELNLIQENASTVISFTESISYVVELNRRMRQLLFFPDSLFALDRHVVVGQPDFQTGILVALTPTVGKLNNQSRAAREGLSKIDEKFLARLYEKNLPLINRGENSVSNRKISLFDMPVEVIAATVRISKSPVGVINKNNTDLLFILNNTLNDYLIKAESVSPMLLEDTETKINKFTSSILICLTIAIVFGAMLLIVLAYEERKHILKRNQFIDILLMNNEHYVEEYLKVAKGILEASKLDIFSEAYFSKLYHAGFRDNKTTTARKFKTEKNTKSYVKKTGIRKRINLQLLKVLFLGFFLIFLFLMGFIVLYIVLVSSGKSQQIYDQLSKSVTANYYIYQIRLLEGTIYSYIHEDGNILLRNNPMGPEWDKVSKNVTHFSKFLVELEASITEPSIKKIIRGNICDFNFSNLSQSECETMAGGIVTKGLVNLVNYYANALRDGKDAWDGSNHTHEAMIETFLVEGMVNIERLGFHFAYPSYERIQSFMRNETILMIQEHQNTSVKIIVTFIVIYSFAGLVIWNLVWKLIVMERTIWRKMIRQIPNKMLLNSKMLKLFLINNCDHALDSVKNKLFI